MKYFDPICTLIFAIIVIFTTVPVSKDCMNLLMEASPKENTYNEIKKDFMEIGEGNII